MKAIGAAKAASLFGSDRRIASMKMSAVTLSALLTLASCGEDLTPGNSAPDESVGSRQTPLTTSCTSTALPTWPTAWRSMLCHGAPANDPVADVNPAIIDAVGTSAFPAV